ncbi:hypothetical protein IAT38_001715 [Cryptococcus sp. DSM 104549]
MSSNTTSNQGTTSNEGTTSNGGFTTTTNASLASRSLSTVRGIQLTKSTVYSNIRIINDRSWQGWRSTAEELEMVQRQIGDVFTRREILRKG